MFVVEYDLWSTRFMHGIWNIAVDTLAEALELTKKRCCRMLGVLEVTVLDGSYGRYVVYAKEVQKGSFKVRKL